jgi:glucans biosynthesis protein C
MGLPIGTLNSYLLYLLTLPVFLSERLLPYTNGFGEGRNFGGWFLMDYLIFFTYGFFIIPKKSIMSVLKKYRWLSLILSIGSLVILGYIRTNSLPLSRDVLITIYPLLTTITTWVGILAFLGIAAQYGTSSNRFLKYASPVVMPFYVFHQSVIVAIGYFMISSLDDQSWAKFLLLMASSFIVIIILYEIIRRIPGLRFLFGIK